MDLPALCIYIKNYNYLIDSIKIFTVLLCFAVKEGNLPHASQKKLPFSR